MMQAIAQAIQNRDILSFTYDGYERVIEPHALGISTAGNRVLRGYQVQGMHVTPGHNWGLFDLAKMRNLRLTGERFFAARPGYKRGDKGMMRVVEEL